MQGMLALLYIGHNFFCHFKIRLTYSNVPSHNTDIVMKTFFTRLGACND